MNSTGNTILTTPLVSIAIRVFDVIEQELGCLGPQDLRRLPYYG